MSVPWITFPWMNLLSFLPHFHVLTTSRLACIAGITLSNFKTRPGFTGMEHRSKSEQNPLSYKKLKLSKAGHLFSLPVNCGVKACMHVCCDLWFCCVFYFIIFKKYSDEAFMTKTQQRGYKWQKDGIKGVKLINSDPNQRGKKHE